MPFVAHNVGFERIMFGKILGQRFGWPVPPLRQWWCTAAMAAALSLPRDLARAGEVLGLSVQKDADGAKVMRAMMRPYRTEKVPCWLCGAKSCGHPEQFRLNLFYREDPELLARGIEYRKRDVETERELCRHIRPLPPIEREVWLLDQLINERGVMIDLLAVRNAQKIVAEAMQELNDRAAELTGGYLASQVQKLKWWCNFERVNLSDLRRETVRDLLLDDDTLDENVRKALELRQEAAKTSTAKLNAFGRRACADGRMRDNLMYHGAGMGRWSGRGAQLQNLPSRFMLTKEQRVLGAELIRQGVSTEDIRWSVFGSPLEVVSASLRGMIIAGPGKEFTVRDFNAIEARGTAWLAAAGSKAGTEIFSAALLPMMPPLPRGMTHRYNVRREEVLDGPRVTGRFVDCPAGRRAAGLAVQRGLGVLPERRLKPLAVTGDHHGPRRLGVRRRSAALSAGASKASFAITLAKSLGQKLRREQ